MWSCIPVEALQGRKRTILFSGFQQPKKLWNIKKRYPSEDSYFQSFSGIIVFNTKPRRLMVLTPSVDLHSNYDDFPGDVIQPLSVWIDMFSIQSKHTLQLASTAVHKVWWVADSERKTIVLFKTVQLLRKSSREREWASHISLYFFFFLVYFSLT